MLEIVSLATLGTSIPPLLGNFLLAASRGNCEGRWEDVIRSLGAVFQLGVRGTMGVEGGKDRAEE